MEFTAAGSGTPTTTYKLYHYWRSSSSWRVRWAMAYKNIPCEFLPINLLENAQRSEDHLARNPLGYVPVLAIQEAGLPVRYLAESIAIIEYLEEMHPSPSLLPGDAFQRAQIRQLAEVINAGTQPLQNLCVGKPRRPFPPCAADSADRQGPHR